MSNTININDYSEKYKEMSSSDLISNFSDFIKPTFYDNEYITKLATSAYYASINNDILWDAHITEYSPIVHQLNYQMCKTNIDFVLDKFIRKTYAGDNVKLVLLLGKTSTNPDRKVVITYVNNKYLYSLYVKPL